MISCDREVHLGIEAKSISIIELKIMTPHDGSRRVEKPKSRARVKVRECFRGKGDERELSRNFNDPSTSVVCELF